MRPVPESPRRLPPEYVEQVRLWERELERRLLRFQDEDHVSPPESAPRSFLPLTESNAPRIYRFARDVASVLRCDAAFEAYSTSSRTLGRPNNLPGASPVHRVCSVAMERFRELEARAAAQPTDAEAELERRFQDLERRARGDD